VRKAPDHDRYQSAELLCLAGQLDKQIGKPVMIGGDSTDAFAPTELNTID